MRLKEAFNILKPSEPSYQALHDAHEAFIKTYGDNVDLLKVGQAARECLIEKDIFWFCDHTKYTQETADMDILAEIQQRLTAVRQMPDVIVEIQGTWIWVSGPTDPYEEELKILGFTWRTKKKAWTWCPANLN